MAWRRVIDERREHPRAPISVEVLWEGAAGKNPARISDLSAGGCFVDTIGEVVLGETVHLTLCLPEGEPIEVSAEVVYALPRFGFGVKFIDLSEADQKRLERTF